MLSVIDSGCAIVSSRSLVGSRDRDGIREATLVLLAPTGKFDATYGSRNMLFNLYPSPVPIYVFLNQAAAN